METTFYEFYNTLPPIVPDIVSALLIFFGALFLARFMRKFLEKMLQARGVDLEISILLSQLLYWAIFTFGTITSFCDFLMFLHF